MNEISMKVHVGMSLRMPLRMPLRLSLSGMPLSSSFYTSNHLLVWSLRRRTRAGVDRNECVSFVAVVNGVMIVSLGVFAIVRVNAIVVVRRIPTVDVEIVCRGD